MSVLRPDACTLLLEDWITRSPRNNANAFDRTAYHVLFAQNPLAALSDGGAPNDKYSVWLVQIKRRMCKAVKDEMTDATA